MRADIKRIVERFFLLCIPLLLVGNMVYAYQNGVTLDVQDAGSETLVRYQTELTDVYNNYSQKISAYATSIRNTYKPQLDSTYSVYYNQMQYSYDQYNAQEITENQYYKNVGDACVDGKSALQSIYNSAQSAQNTYASNESALSGVKQYQTELSDVYSSYKNQLESNSSTNKSSILNQLLNVFNQWNDKIQALIDTYYASMTLSSYVNTAADYSAQGKAELKTYYEEALKGNIPSDDEEEFEIIYSTNESFAVTANGTFPVGWLANDNGTIHQYGLTDNGEVWNYNWGGNTGGGGCRSMTGYSGDLNGAAIYWRNVNGASTLGTLTYGEQVKDWILPDGSIDSEMPEGIALQLDARKYQIAIRMCAWKNLNGNSDTFSEENAPKYDFTIEDLDGNVYARFTDLVAMPNVNGSQDLPVTGVQPFVADFIVDKAGYYMLKFSTTQPSGEYLLGGADLVALSSKTNTTETFLIDNMAFKITSQTSEKTVTYVQGPSTEQLTVPSSVSYSGKTYTVTAIADSAFASLPQLKSVKIPSSVKAAGKNLFAESPHVAAITWEAPIKMTQEMAGSVVNNPNLLFYTSNMAYALDGVTNVINLQTKQAERIVLSDGESNDFYCPEEFTASSISYTHDYRLFTVTGKCQGWESLVLPFDATEIIHEKNGIITPFGVLQIGRELENGTKPFWLYEYTKRGAFAEAEGIEANVPYILSMPNEERLLDEYILAGKVTFKGMNATVKASSNTTSVKSGIYNFTPNYQNGTSETVYLLNVDESYDGNPKGSVFVKSDLIGRQTRPFEAYFHLDGSAGVKFYFSVFDGLTDGIRSMEPAKRNSNAEYYQLDGTKRTSPQRGFNIIRTKDGKTQKVLVP